MKTKLFLPVVLLLWAVAPMVLAGTNETSALLQKGLFEEEANRNLDAAIQAYQTVISQTDKEHQLAATAIFRLGECYRKQNKTNEAGIQYQRILHEFADQADLAKLSRQQLGTEAANSVGPVEFPNQSATLSAREAAAKTALDTYTDELKELADTSETRKLRVLVQQKYPNPVLNTLMEEMLKAEQSLAVLKASRGDQNQEVQAEATLLKSLEQQILDQVSAVIEDLKGKKARAQTAYDNLHALAIASAAITKPAPTESVPVNQEAAEDTDVKRIAALIRDSPDLINGSTSQGYGDPPLISAVRFNQVKVVKFLLENHANPEVKGPGAVPPLHIATESDHAEIVQLLLDYGADINTVFSSDRRVTGIGLPIGLPSDGFTALHIAASRGNKAIAEILLARGAKINAQDAEGRTPLYVASEKGFKTIVELLLAHQADIALADKNGLTPFSAATKAGNLTIAKLLLANHADLNAKGKSTPLLEAITLGNKAVFEFLLGEKADVNAPQADGTTPLLAAAVNDRLDFARALLERGADVNAQMTVPGELFKWTAINFAIQKNDNPLLALLLDHHADPNTVVEFNAPDTTPLMMAVYFDRKEAIEILLAHQANIQARNKFGRTALHLAVERDNTNLVELLLTHHADINAQDQAGFGPLHIAAALNLKKSLEILLAHHADVNLKDNQGNSALDLRLQRLNQSPGRLGVAATSDEIVELLRQHGGITELERGTIRITGAQQRTLTVVFRRDPNSYNHFTLFETIANAYSPSDAPSWRANDAPPGLQFPDFSRVKIRHLQPDGATNILSVDVDALMAAGDCSGDIPMKWGDIVEIPELDHNVNATWGGLSDQMRTTLDKCLHCEVEIVVKGQSTKMSIRNPLANFIRSGQVFPPLSVSWENGHKPFELATHQLDRVVHGANVILASSDLTRVKVKRLDPATHKIEEMVFNLEKMTPAGDLWLRDGDVIEIPEKP